MKKIKISLLLIVSFLLMISAVSAENDINDINFNEDEINYSGVITLNSNEPIPYAPISPHLQDVFVGDTFEMNVSFSNEGNMTGFRPGVQLIVPYGIDIDNASYIGLDVMLTKIGTFNAANNYTLYDPMVKQYVKLDSSYENFTLYTIKYPLGSFTPGSPDAIAKIQGSLSIDALLGEHLNITAIPWFVNGKSDTDGNHSTDPPIKGITNVAAINPIIIKVKKDNTLDEDETATGENYPYEYVVFIDIAPGVEIGNFTISDFIPNNLKYLGNLTITKPTGFVENINYTVTAPDSNNTGGLLLIKLTSSVTGTDDENDLILRYWVYAPEFYLVNGTNTTPIIDYDGQERIANNTAYVNGTVERLINGTYKLINVSGSESEIVRLLSLAVEKHINYKPNQTIVPGGKIVYTIYYEVSDYFALDDFILYDQMGNKNITGEDQILDYSSLVTFSFKNMNFTFNLTNTSFVKIYQINDETNLTFNVTAMLKYLGIDNLTGGLFDNLTDGNPSNNGATRGFLEFTTIVNKKFASVDVNGEYALKNHVHGNATNLNGNNNVSDASSTTIHFPRLLLEKKIYAVNGNTSYTDEMNILPGDVITFSLYFELPTGISDFINLTDYLPSNVFLDYNLAGKTNQTTGVIPDSGNWAYLDDGRLYDSHGNVIIPDIGVFGENIYWYFNDTLENLTNVSIRNVTILFTVTVADHKMENDLPRTNRAVLFWSYTLNKILETQSIAAMHINQPELAISKNVNETVIENNTKVQYSINITNIGDSIAYNVTVVDDFRDKYSNYSTISDTYIDYGNGTIVSFNPDLLFNASKGLVFNQVAPNATFLIFYSVTFNVNVIPREVIVNKAKISAFYSTNTSNKNYVTFDDEYSDDVNLTGKSLTISKDFLKSNITNKTNLTIGDVGVFNITVTIPDLKVTNMTITDTLPAGFKYLNYTLITSSGTQYNVTFTDNGQSVTFKFIGDLDPSVDKTFTLILFFKVLNTTANPLTTNIPRVNQVSVTWLNDPKPPLRDNETVRIYQPNIIVTKVFEKEVMYSFENNTIVILLRNTGLSTAYNVTLTDNITNFINKYFNVTGITADGNSTFNLTNGILTVTYDQILPGANRTIRIAFNSSELFIGELHNNTAYAKYYSFPENSTDNIREYNKNGTGTLLTDGANITKIIMDSIYHGNGEATIGNVITYNITIKLPLGLYYNITIEDFIPLGLGYLNHSFIGSINNFNYTYNNGVLTFIYTGLTNVSSDSFYITILIDMLVLNHSSNYDGVLKTNIVNLTWNSSNENHIANASFKVVEPKLIVTKIANETNTKLGNVIEYTIVVTNIGNATAYNINISDIIPDYLEFNGNYTIIAPGWNFTYDPLTKMITVFGNSLNVSESFTFKFQTTVQNNLTLLGKNITNFVNITYESWNSTENRTYETNTNNSIHILASDLVVTKINITEVIAGEVITYLINVTNNGPDTAVDVNLTDLLPNVLGDVYYQIGNGTWIPVNGTSFTIRLGDILPGQSIIIKVNGTLNSNETANVLINRVNVSTSTMETDYTNNNDSVINNILKNSNITFTKTTNITTGYVSAGDMIQYNITVNNHGPSDAVNITVYDNIPNDLEDAFFSIDNGVTWNEWLGFYNIVSLGPRDSLTILIRGKVSEFARGTLENTANLTINNNNTGNSIANDIINVVENNTMIVVKTANETSVYPGEWIEYSINITHIGPSGSNNVTINDNLNPSYFDLSTATYELWIDGVLIDSGIWNGTYYLGKASALSEIILIIKVQISLNIFENATNEANVTTESIPNGLTDNTTTKLDFSDLSIVKDISTLNANYGDVIYYSITITNNGPDNATGVFSYDILPNGLVYINHTQGLNYNSSTGLWTVGDLANGESLTLIITVLVNKTGIIDNQAFVNGNEVDNDLSNNNDSISNNIPPAADIQVNITVSNSTPKYEDVVVYTITVKNNGPNNATNVTVHDIINGLKYINSSTLNGLFDNDNGVWVIGNLLVGEEVVLTITYLVNKTGQVLTDVNVTCNEYELIYTNNLDSTPLNVPLASLLIVNKIANVEIVVIGSTIIYTIVVENHGPDDATGVYVIELLPDSLQFVSYLADIGTYDANTGRWTIGLLNNGETATLKITVIAIKVGNIPNNVIVISDNYNYGNETEFESSVNITVIPPFDEEDNGKDIDSENKDQAISTLPETGNPIAILLIALMALLIAPLRRKL